MTPREAMIAVLMGDPSEQLIAYREDYADAILSALSAAGWVVVPRKLLRKAHACMRESGWHLAMAADVHGDGVLQAAVSEVEEGFATLLSPTQESE